MYCKVLIVDDEYIMRQGIRHMIEWEKEGYTVVGEATNGEEGLAMIEELSPDIVLADIVMPVLDGMEFSKIVGSRFPKVRLIILSSYDKFEYVKQTLLNGACDYVLKPSLGPKTLLEVLSRAVSQIPGMQLSKDSELSISEKLSRYLDGYGTDLTEGDFRHHFPYSRFRLFLSWDPAGYEGQTEDSDIRQTLVQFWGAFSDYVTETFVTGDGAVVLLNYRVRDEKPVKEHALQCAKKLARYHKRSFFVFGACFEGLFALKAQYEAALALTELRFYYKGAPFLCASDAKKRVEAERFCYEEYAERLKYRRFAEALSQLKEYIAYLCDCCAEEYLLKNTAKNLLYNFLTEKEKADGEHTARKSEYFRKIDRCMYADELLAQLTDIVDELSASCVLSSGDGNITKIQQYIKEHYAQNLELAEIARQFNYNYNYLSTYFNQQMKESFSEYLNRVRIDKACELLKQDSYSIAQISALVGYSDPSYFSRIFKNLLGRTPSQWKRRNGKET